MRLRYLLILVSLLDLIFIRLFTEKFRVLPHVMQLMFPLTTTVVLVYTVIRIVQKNRLVLTPMLQACGLFVLLAAVSTMANLSRVDLLGVYLSLFSWLSPIVFFLALQYLDFTREEIQKFTRAFYWFGLVQFPFVLLIDYPEFLKTGDPDMVSGTFGFNAYQLIFFLSLWLFLFASWQLSKEQGRARKYLLLSTATVAVFIVFFLAQWLSILVAFPLTLGAFYLLQPGKKLGKVGIVLTVLALFLLLFAEMNARYPSLRLMNVYYKLKYAEIDKIGKVQLLASVPKIYFDEQAHFPLIGTGPGSYASRAYQTASGRSSSSGSRTNIFSNSSISFGGYRSDMSEKYIIPIRRAGLQIGSTPDNPQMSFVAIFVEYGFIGGVLFFLIYGSILKTAFVAMREARANKDTLLYTLAGASLGGGLIMLQIGFLGTFWESSRVTIPLWIVFGMLYRYRAILEEDRRQEAVAAM